MQPFGLPGTSISTSNQFLQNNPETQLMEDLIPIALFLTIGGVIALGFYLNYRTRSAPPLSEARL